MSIKECYKYRMKHNQSSFVDRQLSHRVPLNPTPNLKNKLTNHNKSWPLNEPVNHQSCLEASGRREKRGKTTKPNIISPANHSTRRQANEPISWTSSRRLSRRRHGKRARSPLVLVLILIGYKKGSAKVSSQWHWERTSSSIVSIHNSFPHHRGPRLTTAY